MRFLRLAWQDQLLAGQDRFWMVSDNEAGVSLNPPIQQFSYFHTKLGQTT